MHLNYIYYNYTYRSLDMIKLLLTITCAVQFCDAFNFCL